MKVLTKLRRAMVWSAGILLLILMLAAGSIYLFQDKIVSIVVGELNKRLNTEVKVDNRIEVSVFEKFPHISVKFRDVHFRDPLNKKGPDLAAVKKVYLAFNPVDLISGNYQLEQIYLENGSINIRIDKDGRANYTIFKEDSVSGKGDNLEFNLSKIVLSDVLVNVDHLPASQYYSLLSGYTSASVNLAENIYNINVDGNLHIYDLLIDGDSYFAGKDVYLRMSGKLLQAEQKFTIHPAEIRVEKSRFNVSGFFTYADPSEIDFSIEGEKGKIQTLLSLLPSSISEKLNFYESEGDVFFTGRIFGKITDKENPLITCDFGFQDAAFYHPELKGKIEKAGMKGYFTNGKSRNSSTSVLKLSKVSAVFQGKRIEGDFQYADFRDPKVKLSASGSFDVSSAFGFYPVPSIQKAAGLVHFSVFFDGRLEDLKSSEGKKKVTASGEILVKDLNFKIKELPYSFSAFNGHFLFNRNDIAINEFRGLAGKSDFLVSGYFRNVISSLIYKDQKMAVQGNLRSYMLDLNELLLESSAAEESQERDLSVLKNYYADLNCSVSHLKYRRFHMRNLKGRLLADYPSLNLDQVHFAVGGGDIEFTTTVQMDESGSSKVHTLAKIDSLQADSLFYLFDNFQQDFLTSAHLKGKISGTVDIHTPLDKDLNVLFPEISGKAIVSVREGELNNFSPMQKLSLFVQEHELYNIRFSELKNEINFSDNRIFIPEMEISSNISNIKVLGTHSFDNQMDYKFTVPLKNFKAKDKDEAYGAIEEDPSSGATKVFLTLKGTPDDFRYGYDTKRTWEKNKMDLRREGDELGDLIRNRYRRRHVDQPQEPQLEEDNYFNFDE